MKEGIEVGGTGASAGAGGITGGELVAGAFVAAALISPGPGMPELVSVCARRRAEDEKKSQRTIMANRDGLPPHKEVKKLISSLMRI